MLVAALVLTQFLRHEDASVTRQLSPKARPLITLKGLNSKDILTVSSYASKDQPHMTNVYRYVFRGDMKKLFREFEARLKKEGWKADLSVHDKPILQKEWGAGPLEFQALVFHSGRIVSDANGGHPVSPIQGKGWVWISYNERPRVKGSGNQGIL